MAKGMTTLFLVMIIGIIVGALWNSVTVIKETAHTILDPTVGVLLDWHVSFGMIIVVIFITLIISLLQKYTTDQVTLKKIKQEQKLLQQEMKNYRDHPQKLLELQKKQLEFIPKTFDITMKPLLYTAIPIILFFRWFNDYFTANPVKIFGFFSWFWAYLLFSIISSMILRKIFKLA